MLIPRAALERVGLLDEALFAYAEDVDWSLRARAPASRSSSSRRASSIIGSRPPRAVPRRLRRSTTRSATGSSSPSDTRRSDGSRTLGRRAEALRGVRRPGAPVGLASSPGSGPCCKGSATPPGVGSARGRPDVVSLGADPGLWLLLHARPLGDRRHDRRGRCSVCGEEGRQVRQSWVLSRALAARWGAGPRRAREHVLRALRLEPPGAPPRRGARRPLRRRRDVPRRARPRGCASVPCGSRRSTASAGCTRSSPERPGSSTSSTRTRISRRCPGRTRASTSC